MPRRRHRGNGEAATRGGGAGRAFWSGTITFGLVSIPVDFYAAVRARETALRMVDAEGAPLGREYYSDKTEDALGPDELVRGYETGSGRMIVVTDDELDALAPELTRDIELRTFVRKDDIPPAYYERPYFLAPSGSSAKAYQLLAHTLRETGRVGVGTFAMRGRQYMVAILSDGQLLSAETLRFAAELRSPKDVGLPKAASASDTQVRAWARAMKSRSHEKPDMDELSDRYAAGLRALAGRKEKKHKDVVQVPESAPEPEEDSGNVIDLMKLLKQRLGAKEKAPSRAAHQPGTRPSRVSARRPRLTARKATAA